MIYYRPILRMGEGPEAADGAAQRLAGGWCSFTHVMASERGGAAERISAAEVPADILARLTTPARAMAGDRV